MAPFMQEQLEATRKGERVRLAVNGRFVRGKFVTVHKDKETLELELSKNPIFVDLKKIDAFQRGHSIWENGIIYR